VQNSTLNGKSADTHFSVVAAFHVKREISKDTHFSVAAAFHVEREITGACFAIKDEAITAFHDISKVSIALTESVFAAAFSEPAVFGTFMFTRFRGIGGSSLTIGITFSTNRSVTTVDIFSPVAPDFDRVVKLSFRANHVFANAIHAVPVFSTVVVILMPSITKLGAINRMIAHLRRWMFRWTMRWVQARSFSTINLGIIYTAAVLHSVKEILFTLFLDRTVVDTPPKHGAIIGILHFVVENRTIRAIGKRVLAVFAQCAG